MFTPPVISVIMNCRNSAEFLQEAIESVYAQTINNWEIIFWDNGSTDNSAKIAKSFIAGQDNRMKYHLAEEVTLLGEARNLAIEKAGAQYIAFLDCDDLWEPEKLEKQLALFEKNRNVGLVCTDTICFSGKRELSRMFDVAAPKRGHAFFELIEAGWVSMSSAMIRRSALNSLTHWFDPAFNVAEEADLFYRLAYGWELDYVDEPLTRWRVHGKNTTFKKFEQFAQETELILTKHKELYPDYEEKYPLLPGLLKRRAAFQKAVSLWRTGKGRLARAEIAPYLNSLKFKVFWVATWLPGACFDIMARIYLALPGFLRR